MDPIAGIHVPRLQAQAVYVRADENGDHEHAGVEVDRSGQMLSTPTDTSVYIARAYAASMRIIEISAAEPPGSRGNSNDWSRWTSFDFDHLAYATFFLLEITRNWGYGVGRRRDQQRHPAGLGCVQVVVNGGQRRAHRECARSSRNVSQGQLETSNIAGPHSLPGSASRPAWPPIWSRTW